MFTKIEIIILLKFTESSGIWDRPELDLSMGLPSPLPLQKRQRVNLHVGKQFTLKTSWKFTEACLEFVKEFLCKKISKSFLVSWPMINLLKPYSIDKIENKFTVASYEIYKIDLNSLLGRIQTCIFYNELKTTKSNNFYSGLNAKCQCKQKVLKTACIMNRKYKS